MADVLHMDPDLVGTSCFQSDFKKRGVGLRLVEEQLIMGQRSFSADRIRDTFNRGARKSRNGNVNRSFRLSGEVPADRGPDRCGESGDSLPYQKEYSCSAHFLRRSEARWYHGPGG